MSPASAVSTPPGAIVITVPIEGQEQPEPAAQLVRQEDQRQGQANAHWHWAKEWGMGAVAGQVGQWHLLETSLSPLFPHVICKPKLHNMHFDINCIHAINNSTAKVKLLIVATLRCNCRKPKNDG